VMWKRGTKQAAMATLYAGTMIGVIYFVLDLPGIGRMLLGSERLPAGFAGLVTDGANGLGVPFMLVGPVIAGACVLIYIATSLLTPAMDQQKIAKVCWNHPLDFLRGRLVGAKDPRLVALLLVIIVGMLYYRLR
jgi:SSS family solute:Na+ symporter